MQDTAGWYAVYLATECTQHYEPLRTLVHWHQLSKECRWLGRSGPEYLVTIVGGKACLMKKALTMATYEHFFHKASSSPATYPYCCGREQCIACIWGWQLWKVDINRSVAPWCLVRQAGGGPWAIFYTAAKEGSSPKSTTSLTVERYSTRVHRRYSMGRQALHMPYCTYVHTYNSVSAMGRGMLCLLYATCGLLWQPTPGTPQMKSIGWICGDPVSLVWAACCTSLSLPCHTDTVSLCIRDCRALQQHLLCKAMSIGLYVLYIPLHAPHKWVVWLQSYTVGKIVAAAGQNLQDLSFYDMQTMKFVIRTSRIRIHTLHASRTQYG